MPETILLIGTLDTKGEEYTYVKDLIEERGHQVLMMDAGVLGSPAFAPDVTATEVAEAGGTSLEELRANQDRGEAVEVMISGVSKLAAQLYAEGRFDGVMGLGGGGGTTIATAGMRALPVGVPKLMVSTVASDDISPYVDVKDITMMYSVVDIAGLNRLSRRILSNAAGAISGMVAQEAPAQDDKPLIAATMFGVTTPCVDVVREELERSGYEVVVFHATGSGGRAMEGLIEDGYIAAVADVTTTEWCDEVVGGVLSAGPDRLEAAAKREIPQVVSCGALDMVNFKARDTVPPQFQDRNLYRHNPNVTLMRTTPEECQVIGQRIAEKLNLAKGPVTLVLPLRGVSMIDKEGEPFYDAEADAKLFDSLKEHVDPGTVDIVELDVHINDPAFGKTIADHLKQSLQAESN